MVLSRNWLGDFVDTKDINVKDFCDRMTDTGSKVESFAVMGDEIDNVRVGLIKKIEQHPDAERLVVCQVDCGEKTIQVITAAKNVFEGAYVPVCYCPADEKRVTKLAGGVEIKSGKLRGLMSEGMFCSIAELGLTTHDMPTAPTDGILILNGMENVKIGADIKDVLMMNDETVEFEITPNRPDCLSVIGLAREAAASFERKLEIKTPVVKEAGDDINKYLGVKISDNEKCFRYSARVIKNVKIEPSPLWLRMRLRASGVRPINNIVDVTNYVMLEYGQPMHAFDYKCLSGNEINVRTASDKEKFYTLDKEERELEKDMLVIADGEKPVAIAGVMGGLNSEITDETKTVVFESAMFLGSSVRITAKKLGMRTESSSRFEKGLDSENTLPALERACELVNLLGAGDVVSGIIDVYPEKKPTYTVKFEPDRINAFLGFNLSRGEMEDILKSLYFEIKGDEIIVPSYRDDVRCMNDIAEEVVRIYGYNKIESSSVVSAMTQGGLTDKQKFRDRIHEILCGAGLDEIYTFSFMAARLYDKCGMAENDTRRVSVEIMNPFGEDTKTMRTTAIPSMLEVLETNCNKSAPKAAIYEMAKVFIPREGVITNTHGLEGTLPDERQKISLGLYKAGGFYEMKGIVESVMACAGIRAVYSANKEDPTFHPGRCANVYTESGTYIGTFGELHPTVAKNYTFDAPVYIGELDFETIFENSNTKRVYTPLPKFPATTRDFSFICDEELEVGAIVDAMGKSNVKVLESIKLFDVYRGEKLGEGKKSVSFSVSLRAPDRTLTVEEADKFAKKILSSVEHFCGITIRQ
ncbi:MAG: phenylalanine--tRNA ligase subunit beta [Clostridiales bacterium]|nr:phenylalanine--tRNA ligase subunit beta [Clostridiales bacterium]